MLPETGGGIRHCVMQLSSDIEIIKPSVGAFTVLNLGCIHAAGVRYNDDHIWDPTISVLRSPCKNAQELGFNQGGAEGIPASAHG